MCFNFESRVLNVGIFILECGFKVQSRRNFIDFYVCCVGPRLSCCLSFPYVLEQSLLKHRGAITAGSPDYLEQRLADGMSELVSLSPSGRIEAGG